MNLITLRNKGNSVSLSYPSKWNELNRDQLIYISYLFLKKPEKDDFKLKAVIKLSSIKILRKNPAVLDKTDYYYINVSGLGEILVPSEMFFQISHTVDFLIKDIYDDNKLQGYTYNAQLTKNIIKELSINGSNYCGPEDCLYNTGFGQWFFADTYFCGYQKTQKIIYLNKLIATLYIKDGEKFNTNTLHSREEIIDLLTLEEKFAIMLFYAGCRNFLIDKYPRVFSGSGSAENKSIERSFLDLVDTLSNGDITKSEKVKESNLHEALTRLDNANKSYDEIKKKLKKKQYV